MGTAIEFASTLIGIIQDPESADKIKASIFIPLTLLKFFNLFLNLVDIPAFRISCKEHILEAKNEDTSYNSPSARSAGSFRSMRSCMKLSFFNAAYFFINSMVTGSLRSLVT